MKKRESFNSRWGFILACIGSAVGMGNIWMFPTRVSLYGGGSFSQALFTPMVDDCSNWRKERHPVTAFVPPTTQGVQAAALANVVKRATTVKKT